MEAKSIKQNALNYKDGFQIQELIRVMAGWTSLLKHVMQFIFPHPHKRNTLLKCSIHCAHGNRNVLDVVVINKRSVCAKRTKADLALHADVKC